MSLASRAARFAVGELAKSTLAAAGKEIGAAIGKRIAASIYPPQPRPGLPGGDRKDTAP